MAAVGICGTDLHQVKGEFQRPTPMVLGHEGAGVVESGRERGDGARARRRGRALLGAVVRRVRRLPARPAGGLRAAAPGDRRGDARGRDDGDLVRGRDGLPRHGDRGARGARGRRGEGRAPDRRRDPAARGGAARLRGADRESARCCSPRASRPGSSVLVLGGGRGRPVPRAGRADRRRDDDRLRRPDRVAARAGARARRDARLRPGRAGGGAPQARARGRRLRVRRGRLPGDERRRRSS